MNPQLIMENSKWEEKPQGWSIHTIFLLGMTIFSIQAKLQDFFDNKLGKRFMLEDLKSQVRLMGEPNQNQEEEKINKELEDIKKTLVSFNKEIRDINKNILGELNIKKQVALLDVDCLCTIIKEKLTYSHESKKTIDLVNSTLKLNLSRENRKILSSIEEISKFLMEKEKFEGLNYLDKVYKGQIAEPINIYSIGYGKTAVLCVGRVIEKAINDYSKKLFDKKVITQKEFYEFLNNQYKNKIGFLKSKRFIDEEEFTDLTSFSFKRNKGGHPDLGEIDNEVAKSLIQQGIWIVFGLQKKIRETQSQLEIENDKARELLGEKVLQVQFKDEPLFQFRTYKIRKLRRINFFFLPPPHTHQLPHMQFMHSSQKHTIKSSSGFWQADFSGNHKAFQLLQCLIHQLFPDCSLQPNTFHKGLGCGIPFLSISKILS